MTPPDPDTGGAGSEHWYYQYDSNGNLTQITRPDDTYQSWDYDSNNEAIAYYEYDGTSETLKTRYYYDTAGNVRDIIQIDGTEDPDALSNNNLDETGWADLRASLVATYPDDAITTYTYTTYLSELSDSPAGLVTTETDPNGNNTTLFYNDVQGGINYGYVSEIEYADTSTPFHTFTIVPATCSVTRMKWATQQPTNMMARPRYRSHLSFAL